MISSRVGAPELIGRQVQLRELGTLLDAARHGTGKLVLLAGEAGVGKTRLVRELAERARRLPDVTVLRGRCYQEDLGVPYAPFVDALDALRRSLTQHDANTATLDQLISALDDTAPLADPASEPQNRKRRLFEGICRAVCYPPNRECRLLVLEDLHWADQTSLELVQYLARTTERSNNLLIIATYRTDELTRHHPLSHLLAELARERLFVELRVPPLTRDELASMIEAMLLRPLPADLLHTLFLHSEGNPFFAEEIVQSLLETGRLEELIACAERGLSTPSIAIPASVKDSILGRTTDLDSTCAEVLRYAAIVGRRFDFELLLRLTTLAEPELVRVLELLVARRLIVEERGSTEDRYSFRHALVREAVYDDMLGRERRLKHRAVLQALETIGTAGETLIDQLAYHSLKAREFERARRYARLAGDRAARVSAYREALAHYEAALDLLEGDNLRERAELLEALAQVAYPLGDAVRMARYLHEARQIYEQLDDCLRLAEIERYLGRAAWVRGDVQTGFAHTRRAVALLEGEPPSRDLAWAYSALSHMLMNNNQHQESIAWGERALTLADQLGLVDVQAHALNNIGCAQMNLGDDQRGLQALERSLDLSLSAKLPFDAVRAYLNLAANLYSLGEFRRAHELLLAGTKLAEHSSIELYNDSLFGKLAYVEMELGNYARAEELIAQANASGRLLQPTTWSCELLPTYIDLLLRQGRLAEARTLTLQQLPEIERRNEPWDLAYLLYLLAQIQCAEGNYPEAAALIDRSFTIWRAVETPARMRSAIVEATAIALRAGRVDLLTLFLELLTTSSFADHPLALAVGANTHGLIAAHANRYTEAATLFAQATAHYAAAGTPYQQASAHMRQADSLLHLGTTHIEEALRALEKARVLFAQLGAAQGLAEAEAALTKQRKQRRGPRSAGSPTNLTRREQQVLALIARGLSNRAIAEELVIAEKTVEIHVSNIFGKLGLNSRAQAAAYAVENRLHTPSGLKIEE